MNEILVNGGHEIDKSGAFTVPPEIDLREICKAPSLDTYQEGKGKGREIPERRRPLSAMAAPSWNSGSSRIAFPVRSSSDRYSSEKTSGGTPVSWLLRSFSETSTDRFDTWNLTASKINVNGSVRVEHPNERGTG